jgi:hypothetical protein
VITNATLRLDPLEWVVSANPLPGWYTFKQVPVGDYTITIWAPGYDELTISVTVNAGKLIPVSMQPSGQTPVDTDGDGLSDVDEQTIYGTNYLMPDTDLDGMPDLFEIEHGLDPTYFWDTIEDPDQDWIVNILEFHLRGDPNDPSSPFQTYAVLPVFGSDVPEAGTLLNPWRTIYYALSQVEASEGHRIVLLLLNGTYQENIAFDPWTTLVGPLFGKAVILGKVVGADQGDLWRITLQEPGNAADAAPLLTIDNAKMTVRNVAFIGKVTSTIPGIGAYGLASGDTLIQNCTFKDVQPAIAIYGSVPQVRRCVFGPLPAGAVVINNAAKGSALTSGKALGSGSDATSGYNTFQNVTGYAVDNERDQSVSAERCDWGTDDPDAIGDKVRGKVDYGNALKSGTGLIPGSIVCSVWDAVTRDPITTASVTLSPGSFSPVTTNEQGVYTIPCLAPGNYKVTVSATGYENFPATVTLNGGEEKSLVSPMKVEIEQSKKPGCFGGTLNPSQTTGMPLGDALIMALAVFVFLLQAMRMRPHPRNCG